MCGSEEVKKSCVCVLWIFRNILTEGWEMKKKIIPEVLAISLLSLYVGA